MLLGWTLRWAVINETELEGEPPNSFLKKALKMGILDKELRGYLKTPLKIGMPFATVFDFYLTFVSFWYI